MFPFETFEERKERKTLYKRKNLSRSSSHDIYKNLNIFSRTNNYPYLPYFSPIFFHLKQPGLVIIHPLHCNKNPFILDNVIRTHVSLHRRFSPFLLFRDPPERGQERRFTRTQSFEAKREEKRKTYCFDTRPINRRSFGPSVWKRGIERDQVIP